MTQEFLHWLREADAIQLARGDNFTVFFGSNTRKESLVYGSGSDWCARLADSTGEGLRFQKWFRRRENAEKRAIKMAAGIK